MLEELSALPDKMFSEPYYFKRSTNIDSFIVFQRFEADENDKDALPYFQLTFNCQAAGTRRQKNCSFTLFVYHLDYYLLRNPILRYHFTKIQNYLSFLSGYDDDFKVKLEQFTEYYETYEPSKDFVLL